MRYRVQSSWRTRALFFLVVVGAGIIAWFNVQRRVAERAAERAAAPAPAPASDVVEVEVVD